MRRFRLTPLLVSLAILVGSASVRGVAQAGAPAAPTTTTTTTSSGSSTPTPSATTSGDPKKATEDSDKVEAAVAAATSLVDDANKYQKTIAAITTPATKSTQPSLDDLQQLQTTVEAISRNKLFDSLADKKAKIASAETARSATTSACSNLTPPTDNSQPDVSKADAACKKAGTDAKAGQTSIDTAVAALTSTLGSISPYVGAQVVVLQGKLKRLSDMPATAEVTVVLNVLPTNLPVLKQVLQSKAQYRAAWDGTKKVLNDLKIAAGSKDANGVDAKVPDDELTKLQGSIDVILPNLHTWFETITAQMKLEGPSFDNMISGVLGDPAKNSAAAIGAVRDKSDEISSAQGVVDAWPPLVSSLVDGEPQGFVLKTAKASVEDLQTWLNVARGAVSRVHDALAGDMSGFETDQVSLYYFTDVQRLMYALNEGYQTKGGVAEAQEQAKAQRTALTQTELELADAQATVNRYQKQVLDLQEQQRQAQAKLKGLNSNVGKLGNRLNNTQDAKNQADADYQQAKSDQAAAPTDPTKTTELNKAAAKQTAAATKLSQSQSDYNAAKSEQDKAQSQVDDSQNQSDSLPAKLAAAQQAMSDAQTAVAAERRKMIMAAQAESDAFAFARDNTPFMVAFADASSSNPAKRVMLYAFNDSKTIFMRGKPEDLSVVKHMISVFDTPAPQARLTLWTFQLSADSGQKTNRKSAEKLNRSMEIVDEELGDTRALENTTLALLRDVVNDEVMLLTDTQDCPTIYRLAPPDCQKLKRMRFYDPSVLTQLSFDGYALDQTRHGRETSEDAFYRSQQALVRLRKLIPDPADTTTLGEALLVLSLASPATKESVRLRFEQEVNGRLPELPLKSKSWPFEHRKDGPILPLTWHALNIWGGGPSPQFSQEYGHLSASQLEIVRALRASFDKSVLNDVLNKIQAWSVELGGHSPAIICPSVPPKCPPDAGLYERLDTVKEKIAAYVEKGKSPMLEKNKPDADALQALQVKPTLTKTEKEQKESLTQEAVNYLSAGDQIAYDDLDTERMTLEARLSAVQNRSAYLVRVLQSYGLDVQNLLPSTRGDSGHAESDTNTQTPPTAPVAPHADRQAVVLRKSIETLKQQILNYAGLGTASPRVAAADEMLKEIIIAVEDDLSREFVQPMIERLRIRLMSTGASVGVVQRESLLATNRGVARIDPRASAQLAVGDQEDILSGVQQLAQLYGAVQSGGALAALGALQQHPREPQPEIYALNTGNKFQVTPVFDPSGQALRFKFDFVATANVQEPNGSTNTQLSRIERHTVNTEVQLSNLETREISRFEVNARLGLPTTYWGGIPILKDIPHIRPWVPLVGWFVRKGGSNASAQQSVIFGQTTIYPTIGALIDLVSDGSGSASLQATNPQ